MLNKTCLTCSQPIDPQKLHICKLSDCPSTGAVLEKEWAKMGLDYVKRQELRDDLIKLGVEGFS